MAQRRAGVVGAPRGLQHVGRGGRVRPGTAAPNAAAAFARRPLCVPDLLRSCEALLYLGEHPLGARLSTQGRTSMCIHVAQDESCLCEVESVAVWLTTRVTTPARCEVLKLACRGLPCYADVMRRILRRSRAHVRPARQQGVGAAQPRGQPSGPRRGRLGRRKHRHRQPVHTCAGQGDAGVLLTSMHMALDQKSLQAMNGSVQK